MNMYEDVVKRDKIRLYEKYKHLISKLEDKEIVNIDMHRDGRKWIYNMEYRFS